MKTMMMTNDDDDETIIITIPTFFYIPASMHYSAESQTVVAMNQAKAIYAFSKVPGDGKQVLFTDKIEKEDHSKMDFKSFLGGMYINLI
jgi:hypothetical protein